jgi:hypothetical protein
LHSRRGQLVFSHIFDSAFEVPTMSEVASQLEEIASRAVTLYSRPTVAMELMRLADRPGVEASALKNCVARYAVC